MKDRKKTKSGESCKLSNCSGCSIVLSRVTIGYVLKYFMIPRENISAGQKGFQRFPPEEYDQAHFEILFLPSSKAEISHFPHLQILMRIVYVVSNCY